MDLASFKATLAHDAPPDGLGGTLQALWHQGKGDWERAHELAQAQHDTAGAWVHAHLHRVEGDNGNAAYWYRQAGRPICRAPLAAEWEDIAATLLEATGPKPAGQR